MVRSRPRRPARHGEISAGLGVDPVAMLCIARPMRPGAKRLGGVGARPNFLRGQAKKRWGLAKGVGIPLVAFFAYFLSHHRK